MKVCVHGLGRVGLATAAHFVHNDHTVVGFDTDDSTVAKLKRGYPEINEPKLKQYIVEALANGLEVRTEPVPADYHLVDVPIPYDHQRDRSVLTCVEQAGRNAGANIRQGDTIVIESTVPPGTTGGVFRRITAQFGQVPGEDFNLGYAPPPLLPGDTVAQLRTNDRLVSGITDASTDAIVELYDSVTEGRVKEAPNPTTAEFVKLAQAGATDVEMAYANTLALMAADYGVDVRKAIELANDQPGVDIRTPGPGIDGRNIPAESRLLGRWSDETAMIDTARQINDRMPSHVIELLESALGTLSWKTVAILGVGSSTDATGTRDSPGVAVATRLGGSVENSPSLADGGQPYTDVRLHDPHADESALELHPLTDAVSEADAIVVTAPHDEFSSIDPSKVKRKMTRHVVLDTVDVLDHERWRSRGFEVIVV